MVGDLETRLGLRTSAPITFSHRRSDEWTLAELAHRLDRPQPTLFAWLQRGQLQGRQVPYGTRYFWLIQANEHALEQLQAKRTAAQTRRQDLP